MGTLIRLILIILFIADIIVSYKISKKINEFYINYEKAIEERRVKNDRSRRVCKN